MKRNQHLIPLSHQHHDVLMAVLLIKKGLQKTSSLSILADFIEDFYETFLKRHFDLEEMALFPFRGRDGFEQLFGRMLQEHQMISRLTYQLHKTCKAEQIHNWAKLLEQHIRFEERELLPFLESMLQEVDLKRIGTTIPSERAAVCFNYPIRFWE